MNSYLNFVNVSKPFANKTSIIPIYNPIIKEIAITIEVKRIVSFLLGHETLLSSSMISLVKPGAGVILLFIGIL